MDSSLFAPMLAMTVLILLVYGWTLGTRMFHVRRGDIKVRYFKTYRGEHQPLPDVCVQAARNLANQFEMPVLFFVGCLAAAAYQLPVRELGLDAWAWAFVGIRYAHAAIHLTYNHVMHRLVVFTLGFLALAGFWWKLSSHLL